MAILVGINGFGRIGRIVSRACLQSSGIQLAAINDPAISEDYVSYLMKYDSTHGKLNRTVTYNDREIIIDGQSVKVFHEKHPLDIPWQAAGVQYVVEASGMFNSYEKASGHLVSIGVKRVIVTAPSLDVPMVILGVNDKNIPSDRKVISCASSTLYCLAPIIKVLEDNFGVEDGFVTSIHAMTPSLKPQDGLCLRGKHWRDHRSIHQNIIPAHMRACKAIGKILPSVKDKLAGLAFRVPIVNVSLLDLTVRLRINTTLSSIISAVQHASKSSLRNIIKVCNEESVSSDFIGESHSCVLEQDSSLQLKPNFFKIICWYENEHSYACRVIDSIIFSENQFYLETPIAMNSMRPAMFSKKLQTERLLPFFCNDKLRGSNDLGSTMSSVESKDSNQSLLERKQTFPTLSTLIFPKKTKTDELIKIWNNRSEIQPSLEPTTCSIFHSCEGFSSTCANKIECNSRQCLENVKREFTKMVNITEDLLRKTQSNQGYAPKDDNKDSAGNFGPHVDKLEEEDKSNDKIYNNKGSLAQKLGSKCSGDTFQMHDERSLKDKKSYLSIHNERYESNIFNSTVIRDSKLLDISERIKELCDEDMIKEEGIQLESKKTNRNFLNPEKSDLSVCNKQIEDSIITSLTDDDILSQNKQDLLHYPKSETGDSHRKIIVNYESSMTLGNTTQSIHSSSSKEDNISLQDKKAESSETNNSPFGENETTCKVCKCEIKKVNNNIEIMHKELKKRKIILVKKLLEGDNVSKQDVKDNYSSVKGKDENLEESMPIFFEPVFTDTSIFEGRSKCGLPSLPTQCCMDDDTKDIYKDGLCKNPQDIYNDGLSENPQHIYDGGLCENPQDVYDSRVHEDTQDIYDKLDSSSGTDSDNSFQVNEKKSQIIQLSDLTQSIDDLTRLNNICRIIEISDEMSDKLFSALDDMQTDVKTWSFKDLCLKLNLDEFCDKVFSGTAV